MRNGNRDISGLVEPDRVHRLCYTDPDIFAEEMERIHETAWIYVGHKSQVKAPGDYYTAQVGRQPMFMVRGHDGEVRVFYNRCPHRGAMLCSDRSGNPGRRFRCSYHAWMYNFDGTVASIPAIQGYDGTRMKLAEGDAGLKPAARVDNYRGFYFASLSPDGPDLETFLGGATLTFDQLVDRAPDGDVEVVGDCFRMIQKSNWKIFLENQLDVSHPSATHESTGVSAGQVEREIEKRDGRKPPLAYSFISAFKTPIEEWGKFDTVGHPHGHCFLAGYMGLRPQDPDTVEYETLLKTGPWRGEGRGDPVDRPAPCAGLSQPVGAAAAPAVARDPAARRRPDADRNLAFPPEGRAGGDLPPGARLLLSGQLALDDGERRRPAQFLEMPQRAGERGRRLGQPAPQLRLGHRAKTA